VCSKPYDDDVKVNASWSDKFEHSIARRVEPDVINVMDFQLNMELDKDYEEPELDNNEEGI
jgi:hypothetical protein